MELSDIDKRTLAGLTTVQAYLNRQMQQIEHDIFLLLLMNYHADIRAENWNLDLEKGVLERVTSDATGQQP